MDPVTGSLLGSVASSVLGGIFGSKKKTTTSQSYVDYEKVRRNADAAGLNFLTAVRSGGNGTTTTTAPTIGSREFIGEALGAGLETWFNREQIARDDQIEDLKLQSAKAELESLQRANSIPAGQYFGYGIPQYSGVGNTASGTSVERVTPSVTTSSPAIRKKASPSVVDPVLVMRDDGLTAVNNDEPVEGEADLWGWFRAGTLVPNVDKLMTRNFGDDPMTRAYKWGERMRKKLPAPAGPVERSPSLRW